MKRYVTDTHPFIWFLTENKHLSRHARKVFQSADGGWDQIVVPSIVLVEAILLFQRQRVDKTTVQVLLDLPERPMAGIYVMPLTTDIAREFAEFGPADIPEMADRIIAATAKHLDAPLITADSAIEGSGFVKSVW